MDSYETIEYRKQIIYYRGKTIEI